MAGLAACILIFFGLTLWLLGVSARAAITIAVARVRDGKLDVIRGGLSPSVLSDLRDVIARPAIKNATMRIVRNGDRAELRVGGRVSQDQLQRLRNVIGNVPLSRLAKKKVR